MRTYEFLTNVAFLCIWSFVQTNRLRELKQDLLENSGQGDDIQELGFQC